jgi:5-(carboxyamino)imidazole ribonucleotide synthase
LALGIAEQIGLVGLLAVEMFVQDGRIIVNELAPARTTAVTRPSTPTRRASSSSMSARSAACRSAARQALAPSVMLNLLGDLWKQGQEPDWTKVLADPSAKPHLYDKGRGRPGPQDGARDRDRADARGSPPTRRG